MLKEKNREVEPLTDDSGSGYGDMVFARGFLRLDLEKPGAGVFLSLFFVGIVDAEGLAPGGILIIGIFKFVEDLTIRCIYVNINKTFLTGNTHRYLYVHGAGIHGKTILFYSCIVP
jgi:hypothetical protein